MANEGLVQRAQEPSPAEEPASEEESNLTPEEQESYTSAMQMVGELIYNNDESHQAVLDAISGDDIPAEGIADASMFLLAKVEEAFQGQYPEELILPTVDEITDLLLELAAEAKLFEVNEQLAIDAKSASTQALIDEYGVDPANVEAVMGDITQTEVDEMQSMFGGQNG